jgi:hypothetical protein
MQYLGKECNMFLSEDVDQIDFDISILSKIEHQEGLINHNML